MKVDIIRIRWKVQREGIVRRTIIQRKNEHRGRDTVCLHSEEKSRKKAWDVSCQPFDDTASVVNNIRTKKQHTESKHRDVTHPSITPEMTGKTEFYFSYSHLFSKYERLLRLRTSIDIAEK